MPADFRTRQLRVSQIVNSGSTSTTPLLIYGLGSATNDSGGFTASHFSATGSDTWLFISGTSGAKGSASRGVVTFGGDVVISGTIYNGAGSSYSVGGGGGGTSNWNELSPSPRLNSTASVAIAGGLGSSYAAQSVGSDVFFFVSGTSGTTGASARKSVFGGDVVTSGSQHVIGNVTGANAQFSGDVAINGGDITTSASTFNIASSATTLNLGSSAGKVVVPGDFEVQGTTVTVDVTNITIEDPLISLGFTTGSVAGSAGDRGFIGGITGAGNNVAFAWSNNSGSFVATKTTSTPGATSVVVGGLQPIRASSFQVNGTTAVVTSSNGTTLTLSGTAVVADASTAGKVIFKENGTNYIEFATSGGTSAQIRGIESLYPSLYLSGAQVHVDSYDGNTWLDKNSNGFLLVDSTTASSPKIYSRRGDGLAYDLTLSGADLFLGSNNGRISSFRGTTEYLRSSYNGASDVVFSAQAFNFSVGSAGTTQLSGSTVNLNHGAGTVTLQRHAQSFLTISSGSGDLASIVASIGKQFQVGGTGLTKLSGSLLALSAGASGIGFEKDNTNFITLLSGSGQDASVSAASGKSLTLSSDSVTRLSGSNVQVTGSLIAQSITGSLRKTVGNLDFITGSGVTVNYNSSGQWELTASGGGGTPAGSNTQVQFNADGAFAATSGLTFATGSSSLTISGDLAVNGGDITTTESSATIFSTNVSTLSLASAASSVSVGGSSSSTAFTLSVAANRTGNSTLNLGTGATSTGNTKSVNIGQGGDPGSTTNIRLGTTDTNAATNIYMSGSVYVTGSVGMKGSIIPDATSTYTLGTDALRWAHVYTGDLHLRNERGDWTIIEEPDFLRIVNNKTGKSFKMLMQSLD